MKWRTPQVVNPVLSLSIYGILNEIRCTMLNRAMNCYITLILIATGHLVCGANAVLIDARAQAIQQNPIFTSRDVECRVENYKPRSNADLAAVSPRELIDELVKINPDSFDSYRAIADYEDQIKKLVRKSGVKALSVISEYIDSYDHKNRSKCSQARFATVTDLAWNIDIFDFRLRATREGQLVINSLEKALQTVVDAEPGLTFANGRQSRHQPVAFIFLGEFKGINEVDRSIADTFWVRYKIKLSEDELIKFTSYLVSRDRKYPSWSKSKLIKDYSRINEAGNPAQVYIFDNPKPYHRAYREFKRTERKQEP